MSRNQCFMCQTELSTRDTSNPINIFTRLNTPVNTKASSQKSSQKNGQCNVINNKMCNACLLKFMGDMNSVKKEIKTTKKEYPIMDHFVRSTFKPFDDFLILCQAIQPNKSFLNELLDGLLRLEEEVVRITRADIGEILRSRLMNLEVLKASKTVQILRQIVLFFADGNTIFKAKITDPKVRFIICEIHEKMTYKIVITDYYIKIINEINEINEIKEIKA